MGQARDGAVWHSLHSLGHMLITGASGASLELPQLGAALAMAERNEYDILVVRELDRLSRNLAKQLIVEETLNRYGVKIEYVLSEYDDTPEGRLQKHVRATVAEYEREKIKERMVRGRRNKVKAGYVMVQGRPPYGYRLSDDKKALVIWEPEAQFVRMMFEWVLNLCSINGQAKKGIPVLL